MPEKDGIETILELKSKSSALKIIAISVGGKHGMFDYLKQAMDFSADKTLEKPHNNDELLQAVEELLEK
jgi:YesN/AraC family two-component response regulator